jgi:hypothetical protein
MIQVLGRFSSWRQGGWRWSPGWRFPESLQAKLPLIGLLVAITWLTFSRLLAEDVADHVYDWGNETLRAVQAWENNGYFRMAGFFPLGGPYFPPNHFPPNLYQSYPSLYLLPYWLGYRLFGREEGFPAVKIGLAFLFLIALGLALGRIASLCFAGRGRGTRQLVFAVTYAITITNEAALRFTIIDEPDYLGMLLMVVGVALLGGWWCRRHQPRAWPVAAACAFFFAAWVYPILGALLFLSSLALGRLRLEADLLKGLRVISLTAMVGMGLYWIQRLIANLMFPEGLWGSSLYLRMGLSSSTSEHQGVLDSLQFLVFQMSRATIQSSGLPLRHLFEHSAIWVLGVVLFAIAFLRSQGRRRQLLLILAAAQLWLFIPLLHQSLSQHAWIYGIHFLPTVVLGWVGGLTTLLPRRPGSLITPWMLGFFGMLIWAIQLRYYMVAYLNN